MMKTATVFKNGHSTQAIRIPKEYRLPTKEVWIKKRGNALIITPKPVTWDDFFNSPLKVSEDFLVARNQQPSQKRDEWNS
jgi:antitoxin VapB